MSRREQKRELIIIKARNVFSLFGLNKTTMEQIARATRMGKATLYHYFRDKEHLLYEVIRRETRMMIDAINDSVKDITNPKDKLRNYINVRMNYLNKLVIAYSALRDDYLNHLSSVQKIRSEFNDYEIQMLSSIIQDGIDNRVFAVLNVSEITKVFSIALRGMEISSMTDPLKNIDQVQMNLLTDTLLYGICK